MSLLVPPYWRNEISGKLAIAVERFFQEPDSLTSDDIENLKVYISTLGLLLLFLKNRKKNGRKLEII